MLHLSTRTHRTIRCLGLALATVGALAADLRPGSIPTRDGDRTYLVASPSGAVRPGRPLVILLHGHTGSARHALGQGRGAASPLAAWLPIVDREGVVVVALDGARGADGKQGWNDGRPGKAGNPVTDDVEFVRRVLVRLQEDFRVDPSRVYAMGMSNGGVMVFRLALDLDTPLAAIAAVCATMPGDRPPSGRLRPVSVLLIEGTADPLMPYGGGQVTFFGHARGSVLGVEATLAVWRRAAGLPDLPVTESLPHLGGAEDPTRVTRSTWGGTGGLQVRLLRVEGGGHAEPTLSRPYGLLYRAVTGPQNGDLESAEEAWAFFRDKRAPGP
jgi:polyhydroxybutyrate depolymerase